MKCLYVQFDLKHVWNFNFHPLKLIQLIMPYEKINLSIDKPFRLQQGYLLLPLSIIFSRL